MSQTPCPTASNSPSEAPSLDVVAYSAADTSPLFAASYQQQCLDQVRDGADGNDEAADTRKDAGRRGTQAAKRGHLKPTRENRYVTLTRY